MFPKHRRYQNKSYRRFVASFPCFNCGMPDRSQCAHANGGGMGTKASDLDTFPLCASMPGRMGCHDRFDLCTDMTKAERRELTTKYIKRMQDIAREHGRPEFKEAACAKWGFFCEKRKA